MYFKTIALALASALPAALAGWVDMSVPKTIVLGKPFNITGHFTPTGAVPVAGSVILSVFNTLPDPSVSATLGIKIAPPGPMTGPYDVWMPNVVIPSDAVDKGKQFYLQYLALTVSPPGSYLAGQTLFLGPMKAGTAISPEIVTATSSDERSRFIPYREC